MKRKQTIAAMLVIIWALAAFPLVTQPAAAQTDGPQMTATAAFDGYFKYGEWLPIWVELENQGRDMNGEVRVQVSSSQGTTVFASPVSLPSGSRKFFPVYVLPNNFSRELEVRLMNGDQLVTSQKVSVHPQPNITYLIGLITPERGALGLLSAVTLPGQERPKIVVDVPLSDLPERAESMRSFDLLILNNTDTSQLTPGQSAALESWVQMGGRLVIGGGANAARTLTGLTENLKPVQLSGEIEVDGAAIDAISEYAEAEEIRVQGPFITAVGQPTTGSGILVGTENLPLVVERALGNGSVSFVALDVSGIPFNGWPGTKQFWETLIGPGARYPDNMPFDISVRQFRGNNLYYSLSNIPALDLPSIQGLTILLMVYILVVGPLNYFFLRSQRRLHLAWVTIPVITLIFTGGAFGIGYAMRGNDLILNKIALIELQPGGSANVTSFMGLFSPRQQSYEISVNGEGLVSPLQNTYDSGWGMTAPATGGEMVFYQGEPSTIQGLTVNQFSMQSFMAETSWNDFGQLTADLRLENDALKGTVRNDTSATITDVVVTMQNRFVRLGDLHPGEEAVVDLGMGSLQSDRFGPPLSYRLFQEQFNSSRPSRSAELKSNILSSVIDNGYLFKSLANSRIAASSGSGSAGGNILIFGWLDEAPPDVEVRNNTLSQQTTALVYTSASYELPKSGPVMLPVGMIPGSLTQMPRDGGTCGMGSASVHMGNGEAEFEFQIPAEITDTTIHTLRLNMWNDSGGGNWGSPEVALWNWEDDSWTNIQDPIQGTNVIKDAASYVNDMGVVRIRLTKDGNMYSCTYLDLGIEAERAAGSGG